MAAWLTTGKGDNVTTTTKEDNSGTKATEGDNSGTLPGQQRKDIECREQSREARGKEDASGTAMMADDYHNTSTRKGTIAERFQDNSGTTVTEESNLG